MLEFITILPGESALLARLQSETFEHAYSAVHSPQNIKAYCASHYTEAKAVALLSDHRTICKVATVNKGHAGYYIIQDQHCPYPREGKSMELKQIYVLAQHYGTGLGRRLYDEAISEMKENAANNIWLAVSDINYRAKAFYERLGFERLGSGPNFHVGTETLFSSILALRIS